MNSDLVSVLLLSLVAMANPTLLAAVTALLLLPRPRRPMLGYLLGAYTTSIAAGLLIVFSLHGSSAENTSKHKISPIEDILIGILNLTIAYVLATGRAAQLQNAASDTTGPSTPRRTPRRRGQSGCSPKDRPG
jgi:hypothetical protein